MRRRGEVVAAGMVVTLLAATGCGLVGGRGALSVVGDPGDSSAVCTPQDEEGRAVISLDLLRNDGSGAVTVSELVLVNADGLRIIAAGTYDVEDDPPYSGVNSYEGRNGPEGFEFDAVESGQTVELTLVLEALPAGGHADAVEVVYSSGRSQRSVQTTMSVELAPAGEWCFGPDEYE